ncbi:MAG: CHASE3 domain-containing protein [Rhizobiaceae bacterium]|nr:CHASE3 domain-containing protein [Rhizobiaceae bacterium]
MIRRARRAYRLQLLPLVAGFLLIAGIIGIRSFLIESQQQDNQAARDALELQRRIVGLLSLVQDAETGQRGYLLTGNESYLEPYSAAVSAIPGELSEIRKEVAGNTAQTLNVDQLASAIAEKKAELDTVIALMRQGNSESALDFVRSDRGKRVMDRIRELVDEMLRTESGELRQRLDAADRSADYLRYGSLAALAGILLLGIYGVWNTHRRLSELEAAQETLTRTNAALEDEIANREKAEQQTRQLQKMEAIGQLTGGIAHDFNNMLAVIISALNLMQRKIARGDVDVGQLVDAAIDAAGRAASLTSRLLAFSRQQPLAPQVIDANRLLAGMSDLLRRSLGEAVELETVLAGGIWRLHADPSQLENAIVNLAVNARDAMPDGGRLTLETANAHLDDRYAAENADVPAGQYVMLAVTDTGTGMPPEVTAKVFEPFFTTKPVGKGTGLGLSQVFGFVKQSNGHVKVYSELGQGTTVKIYLPRYFGQDDHQVSEAAAAPQGGVPTETILLVEDDPRVRSLNVAALRDLGYTIIHAGSAAEALEKLASHPEVSLLFTDIVMPGMNGRKLADQAEKLKPGIKVLFTTGFTRNAVVHNGTLDHGVDFIAKPFSIEALAAKVREVLDR